MGRGKNLFGAAKVFNVDAATPFSDSAMEMVEKVLSVGVHNLDGAYLKGIGVRNPYDYFNIVFEGAKIDLDLERIEASDPGVAAGLMLILLHSVPVITKHNGISFGLYVSDRTDSFFSGRPHVEIYTDNISAAFPEEESFNLVCALTLLHALANAVMDPFSHTVSSTQGSLLVSRNISAFKNCFPSRHPWNIKNPESGYQTVDFYTYHEEAIAECLVYDVIAAAPRGIGMNKFGGSKQNLAHLISHKDNNGRLAGFFLENPSCHLNFVQWLKMKASYISSSKMIELQSAASQWLDVALDLLEDPKRNTSADKLIPFVETMSGLLT